MSHDRQHNDAWWQDDGNLKKALKEMAGARISADREDAVFTRAMRNLPARPTGLRLRAMRLWESLSERPVTVVAAAVAVVLVVAGLWMALHDQQDPKPVETNPNMAHIENIESVNSTAIVADGNNNAPTVIWVFEE